MREEIQRKKFDVLKQDAREYTAKLKEIEAESGVNARIKFEEEYKKENERKKAEAPRVRAEMMYELADAGICPFLDPKGAGDILFSRRPRRLRHDNWYITKFS